MLVALPFRPPWALRWRPRPLAGAEGWRTFGAEERDRPSGINSALPVDTSRRLVMKLDCQVLLRVRGRRSQRELFWRLAMQKEKRGVENHTALWEFRSAAGDQAGAPTTSPGRGPPSSGLSSVGLGAGFLRKSSGTGGGLGALGGFFISPVSIRSRM